MRNAASRRSRRKQGDFEAGIELALQRLHWLADPTELPKGARIEVGAILAPVNGSLDQVNAHALQIGIDFVPL